MSWIVLSILYLLALAAFLIASFFAAEVLAAFAPGRGRDDLKGIEPGPLVVIIPAHNESGGISQTLKSAGAQLRSSDRILVVADNCTDDTSSRVQEFGVDVLERDDPERRGKGYALQFGLDSLRANPPALVVFLDADCILADGALLRLAGVAAKTSRPAQALYLMKSPAGGAQKLKVAEFAWALMNRIRMQGLQRLFGVTRITGAGFAAPWSLIQSIGMGSDEIVEDLALTMQFTRNGVAPILAPDAVVESEFPSAETALMRQSARWSVGSLRFAWRESAGIFLEGIKKKNLQLIGAALDLMVPPLTVLGTSLVALLAASAAVWFALGVSAPFYLVAIATSLVSIAVVASWMKVGRKILPPSELLGIIKFLAAKTSVFGREGRESTKQWTPTRSANDEPGK